MKKLENGVKPIYCEVCMDIATHSIHPVGGTISYWCTKHFERAVKKLELSA